MLWVGQWVQGKVAVRLAGSWDRSGGYAFSILVGSWSRSVPLNVLNVLNTVLIYRNIHMLAKLPVSLGPCYNNTVIIKPTSC